ncbi:hypothetical protein [Flavobacterium sp. YJ01]|uniref:hypothetical protein n=1 Tax=unclassified Flavobacterium TaxID=196869 RepID=UPI0023E3D00D|nr:hypothetical protein [Flavobacterium sp. YJ01]WET04872.1 hypothetical protein P0R33_11145 [Flavobacterium sp. YJ01]
MEYLKKKKDQFNYWSFIEKFYPEYSSCNNVLLSNILTKKLEGEQISENDEEYIKNWNVRSELLKIDKELLSKAFENYFNTIYPEKMLDEE